VAVQSRFLDYVLEQLAGLSALRSNRMFGGIGLYSEGLFFGLIDDDTVFFKTGDLNIAAYQARNMPRFMPFPDRPQAVLGYHQVPADVIEDSEMLVDWARQSVAVARSAQARKAAKKTAKKTAKKPAKKPETQPRRTAAPRGKPVRRPSRQRKSARAKK
jgi:DNA transformation protein